jgi:DNA-binding transcriptional MocR family regulator
MSDLSQLQKRFESFCQQSLNLNMTRGKPSPEQLDLSNGMLTCVNENHIKAYHTDYRNYSVPQLLTGIPEVKELFGKTLQVNPEKIIVGGNASLNLMYDTVVRCLLYTLPGGETPWINQSPIKFLCPVPGYDRHFNICQSLGIEMINIPLTGHGPDMDKVESLVASDPSIKGIWCVPKYSNPTGETYSDEVVERLAAMPTAASDFRIFWDNAYAFHHLYDKQDVLKDILKTCASYGNDDRVFMFASTSKMTFAGGGISFFISNDANLHWFKTIMANQTIGYDKINMLRHVHFLQTPEGIEQLMAKHAAILQPKFDMVDETLSHELGDSGYFASWRKPRGGYFISFDTHPGCAQKIVDKAAQAGVKLTNAGATFPYGKDPDDKNIRIAPSFPAVDDIQKATEILAVVTKLVILTNQS